MRDKKATYYYGKTEKFNIKFTRVWSMPTPWTFKMKPVRVILDKYVGSGKGWVDPYAGKNSPAGITNDHNLEIKTDYHMEAIDFVEMLRGEYEGVLFDPPYSFTQVERHYKILGKPVTKEVTMMGFYEKVKSVICEKIKLGGYAISFGWNTSGFGKARGFRIIEIMAIAHGGSRNDTLVTVEKKVK